MSRIRAGTARRNHRKTAVTRHRWSTVIAMQMLVSVAAMVGVPVAMAEEADATQSAMSALVPSVVYDGTVLTDLKGGARTGTTSIGNLHLKLAAEAAALGWPGLTAYADVLQSLTL